MGIISKILGRDKSETNKRDALRLSTYQEILPSFQQYIENATSNEKVCQILQSMCQILENQGSDSQSQDLSRGIKSSIPLILQLKFEKVGDKIYMRHDQGIQSQLRGLLPPELLSATISRLQDIAPQRPMVQEKPLELGKSFGADLAALRSFPDKKQRLEGILSNFSSLDELQQYISIDAAGRMSTENQYYNVISQLKGIISNPDSRLSDIDQLTGKLPPDSSGLLSRITSIAIKDWNASHTLEAKNRQLPNEFLNNVSKTLEGYLRLSNPVERVKGITSYLESISRSLKDQGFSTEELDAWIDRFKLFLSRDGKSLNSEIAVRPMENGDSCYGIRLGYIYNFLSGYSNPEVLKNRIDSVRDINTLIAILNNYKGDIKSETSTYSTQEIVSSINAYVSSRSSSNLYKITRAFNLRDTVERILPTL